MPAPLLERIGEHIVKVFSRTERSAPPSMQTTLALSGGGIPPPLHAGEGLKVYQSNPWVYAAVNAIVTELVNVELFIRRKVSTEGGVPEFERLEEHQALELMKDPIPGMRGRSHMNGTQHQMITWIHMLCAGEAIWAVTERFAGIPSQMHILQPSEVSMKLDGQNFISEYKHSINGRTTVYSPEDIIHLKLPDPRNLYRGQSSLTSVGTAIDTDEESNKYLWNYFKNSAIPEAVLIRQKKPEKDEIDRFKAMWKNMYQGSGNTGKVGMLWGGTDIKQVGRSQREMQYKELKEFNRDTIMANLRTGKGVVGMMEDQSRANAEAQDFVFAKRVIRPYITGYVRQLTSEFLPLFGDVEDLDYWYEDPVEDDQIGKADVCSKLFGIGAISINEVRGKFDLDPRDEELADAVWTDISKIPLSDPVEGEEVNTPPPGTPVDDGEDELPEGDDGERGHPFLLERAIDDEFSDLIAKFGGLQNIPFEALDSEELRIMKELGLNVLLLESATEIIEWRTRTDPAIKHAFGIGVDLGIEQAGDLFTKEMIFALPESIKAIETAGLDHAVLSLKATKIDLMRIMKNGVGEGLSNAEIGRMISRKYGEEYKGYRALRIARTETTGIVNAGSHAVLRAEGVKTKRWIVTFDGRQRKSHENVHADTARTPVLMDDYYDVGSSRALHPGDQNLSAGERINCRCTEVNGKIDDKRAKAYGHMFLRGQGSAERLLQRAVRSAFTEQLARIKVKLSATPQ